MTFPFPFVPPADDSARSFAITPAVTGKSQWDLDVDGALDLGATGTWTITPDATFTVALKLWGGGAGGRGTAGEGGPAGYAGGGLSLDSGIDYVLFVGEGGKVDGGGAAAGGGGSAASGGASGGGGYSGCFRETQTHANVRLIAAGGGGMGGGSDPNDGGAGGGSTGDAGLGNDGAGGGTPTAGGAESGNSTGVNGSALQGGDPGTRGGGGGGGYYGGGSCQASSGNSTRSGGGGGSSWAHGDITSPVLTLGTTGTGAQPGNYADGDRGGSGEGAATATSGTDGRFYMS